jgi:hypothetical protein
MTTPYDRERLLELVHRFLDQDLSGAEVQEMESILASHERARRDLALAAALHQELFSLHEVHSPEGIKPALLERSDRVGSPGRRPPTLRTSRSPSLAPSRASWAAALVAAGFLIGSLLLLLMFNSKSAATGKAHRDTVRAPRVDLPAPERGPVQAADPSLGPLREQTEEERIRAETFRRLADLDRRRSQIEQPVPVDADPVIVEKQKIDLVQLAEEKRKIEEEMRAAIEQARRTFAQRKGGTPETRTAPPDTAMSDPKASLAAIERMEGNGWLLRKETRTALHEGTEILPGDGLETGLAACKLVIRFADRTRVELRADSLIGEIMDGASVPAAQGKQIRLVRGSLAAEVTKQPPQRPMLIRTLHSESTVLGTTLRLFVDPGEKGATRLEVEEGRVRITRLLEKRASVDVTGGHFAVAAPAMPLQSHPLPQARPGTPEKPVLTGLVIVNADTGRALVQFDPLEDGTVISLADLSTRNLNIQASTSPATVGSVLFSWDGIPAMEGRAPYFLSGNDPRGKPLAWTPAPGDHLLTVTPYSGPPASNRREGTGTAGTGLTVRLRVR